VIAVSSPQLAPRYARRARRASAQSRTGRAAFHGDTADTGAIVAAAIISLVADPRESITRAQSVLRNTFLLVGAVALMIAVAVATWLATLITGPLRRMASVASTVDGGDLSHRIGPVRATDEVNVLTESFDHMLDRLEGAPSVVSASSSPTLPTSCVRD
jgi:HAMP domain-containing protein